MKILISHKLEKGSIGGMTRFHENLINGFSNYYPDVRFTYDRNCTNYDILFILTPTSIDSFDFIDNAKKLGKKIVLRIDNLCKPSRNKRYRPFEKMVRLATLADQVIYQSDWARTYIAWGKMPSKGTVILNGVNEDVFKKEGKARDLTGGKAYGDIFLVLTSSSDPCKRLHESLAIFEHEYRKASEGGTKPVKLIVAGRLPDEYHVRKMQSNWDFVRGEESEYIGELHSSQEVARVMRGCTQLLFPSFNDAAPNTVLEARACGLNTLISLSGGSPQMNSIPLHKIGLSYMCTNYYQEFDKLLNNKW